MSEKTCQECGSVFAVKPSSRRKYCSQRCYRAQPRKGGQLERFVAKIDRSGAAPSAHPDLEACHVWTGARNHSGYGQFCFDGKTELAHRVAWFLHHGEWPQLLVCHRCDNPSCVNPAHLFQGSAADNIADMLQKGRAPRKFTHDVILGIRDAVAKGEHQRDVARRFGASQSMVGSVARKEYCMLIRLTPNDP